MLRENLKKVLDTIPQQPQRQDGTNEQLRDLRDFAARLGLYDASDYLRVVLDRSNPSSPQKGQKL
jgi:hypothetical protein